MSDLLATLGLTKDELIERVVQKIADEASDQCYQDLASMAARIVKDRQQKDLDKAINEICEAQTAPALKEIMDDMVITPIKEWGDNTGRKELTLKQYAELQASRYLRQQVSDSGSYSYDSWRDDHKNRAAFFIKKYLDQHIKDLVSDTLKAYDARLKEVAAEAHKTFLDSVNAAFAKRSGLATEPAQ